MNGFFVVYALTGWILEGRDKMNWSLEAGSVSVYVGLGIVVWSVVIAGITRFRGGNSRHPLILSAWAHSLIAVALVVSVYFSIRI